MGERVDGGSRASAGRSSLALGGMSSLWTAPAIDRAWPEGPAAEREALERWLDFHRDTLRAKCAGLTADQLKQRSVPPSKLSLLGLVRHMTEVERWWFRIHAADEDVAFQREVELARAAVRGKQLDDVVRSHGHHPANVRDIRWIYLHMIEEYARHNG